MRRSFLKFALGTAAAVPLWSITTRAWSVDAPSRRFLALEEPALASKKTAGAAFFGVARRGARIVCVGERGIVIHSKDDGATWSQATVPVSVTLTSVKFASDQVGWCTGHLGVVLSTKDGGATWTKQLDGLALATLAAQAANSAESTAQAQALQKDGPDKPFFDLYFDDEHRGVVLGAYNLAFRTEDAGRTWKPWMHQVDNPKGLHMYAAQRRGDDLYVAGEQGLLLRRPAGSDRFEALTSPFAGTYFGITVSRAGDLLAFGLRGKAFVSKDGAATWQESKTGVSSSIASGLGLSDGRLLLATQAGDVLVSDDGGQEFKRVAVKEPLPLTSLVEVGAGQVLATTLRGVRRLGPF